VCSLVVDTGMAILVYYQTGEHQTGEIERAKIDRANVT